MDRLLEILAMLEEDHRAELTDDQIGELETELLAAFADIKAGGVEDIEADDVETLTKVAAGVGVLRTEADERYTSAQTKADEIAALEADLLGVDEPEVEADEPEVVVLEDEPEVVVEPVVEPEPELVNANAKRLARTAPRAHRPLKKAATSYIRSGGRDLESFDQIADIMIDRMESFSEGGMPGRELVRTAQIKTYDYEAAGRVLSDDPVVAHAQLTEVASQSIRPEAWADTWAQPVTAGAGWCAPVQPLYDFFEIGETDRPVHAALPSFKASRGAVSIPQSPTLSSIVTSQTTTAGAQLSTHTEANQIADTSKPRGTIACPTSDTTKVEAIVNILEVENLMDKAWPELVRNINRLSMVAWARYTENRVMADMATLSTAVTGNQNLGASRDILRHFTNLGAGIRSRQRIPNAVLRLILPFWVVDMIRDDLMMGMQSDLGFFDVDEAWVVNQFRRRGINVTFHYDGTTQANTATSQILAAQGAGAKIVDLPDTIVSLFFPEGAFTLLDNGTLDLGVVRDSTLNIANKYQVFSESWEKVAKLGYETYVVTSTTCASGASAGTETPTCSGS